MAIDVGTRIGPYEIVALIGEGGMGRVFRARDTTLDRDVAVKVLPDVFASDRERLARFEREAKTLAALNHPNIAHIYGFHQAGDASALAMEFVAGEDLASRLERGAVPLEEAMPLARQIAEAIEAAHEQGIVHRDLKPANIKVRSDGTVKVLDFGLAKALESEMSGAMSGQALMTAPTITSPAMTMRGVILGTAAYMSPEQARGKVADKRSDVWAYGCVLYEMLTGVRAFEGAEVSDTLAAVLRAEPDWARLPAATPDAIRRLLRGCLEKDRKERVPDIAVARLAIKEALSAPPKSAAAASAPARRAVPRAVELVAACVVVAAVTGLIVWRAATTRTSPPSPLVRLALTLPENVSYAGAERGGIAISPDGSRIVYPALLPDGRRVLYMSTLSEAEPKPLAGTDDAIDPFFSPDGDWIGFFEFKEQVAQPARLKKIATRGGPPVAVTDLINPFGGTWGADDVITFASATSRGPSAQPELFRVSANGGAAQEVAMPAGAPDRQRLGPESLPGGKAILYTERTSFRGEPSIAVRTVASGETHTIIEHGSTPRYVPTGHIVYVLGTSLMAVRFDVATLTTRGGPVPLIEGVATSLTRAQASVGVSPSGYLVYARGGASTLQPRSLVWVNRRGEEEPIASPRGYVYPRISPDGTRIALDVREGESMVNASGGVWVWDIARRNAVKLSSSGAATDQYPVWTVDGKSIVYGSTGGENRTGVYLQSADGIGKPEQLIAMAETTAPYSFTPDGAQLLVRDSRADTGDDLAILNLKPGAPSPRQLTPFIHTRAYENNADISRDGRWVAYQADDSGRFEIYVRPFSNPDQFRKLVSDSGGTRPVWSRDGRELFYMAGASPGPVRLMRVAVEANGGDIRVATPQVLFEGAYFASTNPGARGRTYDVAPDGQRFAMVKESAALSVRSPTRFEVVLNWFDELRRVAPTNK